MPNQASANTGDLYREPRIMANHLEQRRHLDLLFLLDAAASLLFGAVALLTPHGILLKLVGGSYNHDAHEVLRLYGCLRIAMGWITLNIRSVDDGRFRRSVCESLCFCYLLQALAVLRAQLTDRRNTINWITVVLLSAIGLSYGRFRFGGGGRMIKVYELPQSDKTIR